MNVKWLALFVRQNNALFVKIKYCTMLKILLHYLKTMHVHVNHAINSNCKHLSWKCWK